MLSLGNNTNGERFKCVCGLSAGKQREVRCFENQRIGSAGPFSVSFAVKTSKTTAESFSAVALSFYSSICLPKKPAATCTSLISV